MLIARYWHLSACHTRSRLLIALLHQRFWIIGVLRVVYRTIKSCITCVKLDAVNPQPRMAVLPQSRVQACRAFTAVGIDYAGPLLMKETQLPTESSCYKGLYNAIRLHEHEGNPSRGC